MSSQFRSVDALRIHKAIHDKTQTKISYEGKDYAILEKVRTGLRYCRIGGSEFIQQNLSKSTKYAKLAKDVRCDAKESERKKNARFNHRCCFIL
jgi:hypothetical protein